MAVEQERGISVASSVMQFSYGDCVFNLLDTPGHKDFSEDTYRVLTAVDAAIMVVDAAKGVEEQTIKLLEVCRLRDTPIITFINKMDREVREPLELLDEIESILKIHCAPVTWPIGMGKRFQGVYHLIHDEILRFKPGEENAGQQFESLQGLGEAALRERFPLEADTLLSEIELVRGAGIGFELDAFLKGKQTPVFFGSGINNFGVREVLRALSEWAPSPLPREAVERVVDPAEPKFTGFVFKIQANMDPQHRDRIAFFRVCSGRYTPGMKVRHRRTGKDMKIANAVVFMANERTRMEDAVAGDIIGIHNHGQLHIGDTLTEGEALQYKGIPYFAPELFSRPRLRDPLRAKQLNKGLLELGEEGAVQVFEPFVDNTLLIGAVGPLQFEIVAHRLKTEYGVDAELRKRRHLHRALGHLPRCPAPCGIHQGQYAEAGEGRRRQPGVSGGHARESVAGAGALAQGRVPRHAGAWAGDDLGSRRLQNHVNPVQYGWVKGHLKGRYAGQL